jgi:DNA-binding CsgD family transcriptional regulator
MVKESLLLREADRVNDYIKKYVTLADPKSREEVFELFDNMYRFFPHWVITTCPMMHPEIHYVSQNCPFVFGCSTEYLIKNSPMEKFFPRVHEDDQQGLYLCYSFMHDHFESIPPEEHTNYRVTFHYRFKKPGGEYIYLQDEKAVLNLRDSGKLYYVLFKDLGEERSFNGVKAEVFMQKEKMVKIREFKPSSHKILSKREQELVSLIKKGFRTKEIACKLNISHHTVRNIKSKLFEKFQVNNSIELLNMAG